MVVHNALYLVYFEKIITKFSGCFEVYWSFGGGSSGNVVPIIIRTAKRTPIKNEETAAKIILIVSHLPNNHLCRAYSLAIVLFRYWNLYIYVNRPRAAELDKANIFEFSRWWLKK